MSVAENPQLGAEYSAAFEVLTKHERLLYGYFTKNYGCRLPVDVLMEEAMDSREDGGHYEIFRHLIEDLRVKLPEFDPDHQVYSIGKTREFIYDDRLEPGALILPRNSTLIRCQEELEPLFKYTNSIRVKDGITTLPVLTSIQKALVDVLGESYSTAVSYSELIDIIYNDTSRVGDKVQISLKQHISEVRQRISDFRSPAGLSYAIENVDQHGYELIARKA